MKHGLRWICAAAFAAVWLSRPAPATEVGDASLRSSLLEGRSAPGLTVGVEKERFYRAVRFSHGASRRIEAENYAVYLGYPLTPWLRLFGTAGYAQVRRADVPEWSDGVLRGRGGVGVHLWKLEAPAPDFMAGAFSLRAAAEIGMTAYDEGGESCRWQEYAGALTLHYNILAEERPGRPAPPHSLDVYAGPLLQWIRGRRHIEGIERTFEENRAAGLAAGANLFLTPALSIGAHLRFFDSFSWSAGIRYVF